MKHNAAYQHERERYNCRREIKSKEIVKDFFTTAVVPFTLVLVRGVVVHI